MIDNKKMQQLRADAQKINASVTVGKNGITDATLEELDRHLKKDKLVKVRLLPSATQVDGLQAQAAAIAERTRSTLIEIRGGTAVYFRG